MFNPYISTKLCIFQSILHALLTYLLTHSMEQNHSWEANRFLAVQEMPSILWNPKVQYRIYKCLPTVRTTSQFNPIHAPSHFLKIYLNIILPFTPGSSKRSLSLRFPHQNSVTYYSITPLIQNNWDGEIPGYVENPYICIFLWILTRFVSLKFRCYYLQYIPASKPFDHAWFEVL
jgi:hypothetical protein